MDRAAILEDLKTWLSEHADEKVYAIDVLDYLYGLEEEYE